MQYVKVENGVITEGPKFLSYSSFDTPNAHWATSQLKSSGYFLVDLTYDEMVEKIDFNNPVITADGVTYNRIPLTADEQTTMYNAKAIRNRQIEYPPVQHIVVALWELIVENRPDASNNLQKIRLSIKQKYPKK